jgi:ATP-dependent RNA helicase RhlE
MENNGFAPLGLHPSLVRALDIAGITVPTPIQTQAIPPALTGSDLVGIAQTGTGKTYAFGLPMLERLAKMKTEKAQGLVILPTGEQAVVFNFYRRKVIDHFPRSRIKSHES